MEDEMAEQEEVEAEEEEALLPLTSEAPDLEPVGWGKRDDGSPVIIDEAEVIGVAAEGCVGDDDSVPVAFWLPSEPPACGLFSWLKKAPPSLRMCLQISSVICICCICRCCRTLSSSKSTVRVGGTCICPCSPMEEEDLC